MRIICLGGGPAGMPFSILIKNADPAHEITIMEGNPAGDAFGRGAIFSAATVANFSALSRGAACPPRPGSRTQPLATH